MQGGSWWKSARPICICSEVENRSDLAMEIMPSWIPNFARVAITCFFVQVSHVRIELQAASYSNRFGLILARDPAFPSGFGAALSIR